MKYQGIRTVYIIFAILLPILAVYGAAVSILRWEDSDVGVRVFLVVELCAILAALFYVLFSLRRPSCYAELRADGIHVCSKEAGELAFLDWNDVKDHRLVTPDLDAPHISYDLLILQRAAPFGDQTISMLRKYRMADIGKIAPYRLDEQMQKLREGSMTAEEFKNLPYLFFVADFEFINFKKGFSYPVSKAEKLWRARRMECRAAGDRPE